MKKSSTVNTFTNLKNDGLSHGAGSNYLEKEYNLVQRIISDTKELKNIKQNGGGSISHATVSQFSRTQEELGQEILSLKKAIKNYEHNELISRAKFEYYENEMAKKEQEILDLLDVKKVFILKHDSSFHFLASFLTSSLIFK